MFSSSLDSPSGVVVRTIFATSTYRGAEYLQLRQAVITSTIVSGWHAPQCLLLRSERPKQAVGAVLLP